MVADGLFSLLSLVGGGTSIYFLLEGLTTAAMLALTLIIFIEMTRDFTKWDLVKT